MKIWRKVHLYSFGYYKAVSLFISRGALRIVYDLDDGEAHLMWGGATRH